MAVLRAFLKLAFVVSLLASFSMMQAQEAKILPRHPGDTIKFEIKFDGPNADKIKTVTINLAMHTSAPEDQAGFANGFSGNRQFTPSAPDTFLVEITVPDNAATGDYFLYVAATAAEGAANYTSGRGFDLPPVRIENPKKFTPPGIKVKPLT